MDRFYKFNFKWLAIWFYHFFFNWGESINFIETETPDTGQRKDAVVEVDGKIIHIIEFMSGPLTRKKLQDIFDYWISIYSDPIYKGYKLKCDVISIGNPKHGIKKVNISENTTFCVKVHFLKKKDGAKLLSTILKKNIKQEALTCNEAIGLLLLVDMGIEVSVYYLVPLVIRLFGQAVIPDFEFKKRIFLSLVRLLQRFYAGDELKEMIRMLKSVTKDPKVKSIIEQYGLGFDEIYYDGKEDGFDNAKLEDVRGMLSEGISDEIILRVTKISIKKLQNLKRNL